MRQTCWQICSFLKFENQDIELERGVVFEEIDMYEDAPDDVATEKLFEAFIRGRRWGVPFLGTEETLKTLILRHCITIWHRIIKDTVVALSGHFTDADLQYICKLFERMMGSGRNQIEPAQYQSSVVVRPKDIEQKSSVSGFPRTCAFR